MNLPQTLALFVNECLFVLDDIWVSDRGEDPDLVDGVFDFLLAEVVEFDLLEGVELPVLEPLDFEDV